MLSGTRKRKSPDAQDVKCVVIGDASVGKTRLLISYTTKSFHGTYIPEPFKAYSTKVVVDGRQINLRLQDTAWQDDNCYLRASHYSEADVILICFSLTSQLSYESVRTKWFREITNYFSDGNIPPVILIGTKFDLCEDEDTIGAISAEEGIEMAKEIKAASYFECSALTQDGLNKAFDQVIRVALPAKIIQESPPPKRMSTDSSDIKCVLVGDGSVGKTRLLISYTTKSFHGTYIPDPFKTYSNNMTVDGEQINLQLQNTPWQDEHHQPRSLHYLEADVILVCFSLTSPTSFENVRTKWFQEITNHFSECLTPTPPIILLGTKVDLRDNNETNEKSKAKKRNVISTAQGIQMGKEIKAERYMECSALTQSGLTEVFDEVIRIALKKTDEDLNELPF